MSRKFSNNYLKIWLAYHLKLLSKFVFSLILARKTQFSHIFRYFWTQPLFWTFFGSKIDKQRGSIQNREVKYFFTSTLIHKFCVHSTTNFVCQVSSEFSPRKCISLGFDLKKSVCWRIFPSSVQKRENFWVRKNLRTFLIVFFLFKMMMKYRQSLFILQWTWPHFSFTSIK